MAQTKASQMKNKSLPRCGLPKRILKHATEDELKNIYDLVNKRDYRWQTTRSDPMFAARRKASVEAYYGLRGIRKVLRKRYSEAMCDGVYTTASSSTQIERPAGKYGFAYAGRLPKHAVITWVERDELGNNWFMYNSNIITIVGTQLDKVIRLEE